MRLGNSTLRTHLYRCGLVSSPLCGDRETLVHFWLECQRYSQARSSLKAAFRRLIGPNVRIGVPVILSFRFIRRDLCDAQLAVFSFLNDSSRFFVPV